MEYELRTYEVKPGRMEQWIREWNEQVVPLRRAAGFEVVGAWRLEGSDTFVWIVGYDGDLAAANAAYYESDARKDVSPDPARHLAGAEQRRMGSVLGDR